MSQNTKKPVNSSAGLSTTIDWLPGQPFVVQILELSSELTDEEVHSAIELSVEAASPIPLEQLAWGWYRDNASHRVLTYMSLRELCEKLDPNFDTADSVYPAFISVIDGPVSEDCLRVVVTPTDLSAVYFSAGSTLPDQIISRQHSAATLEILNAADEEANWITAIQSSLEQLKTRIPQEHHHLLKTVVTRIASSRIDQDHSIYVELEQIDLSNGDHEQRSVHLLKDENRYSCDLRDEAYQADQRKAHRIADYVWTSLIASGITAAILLLLLILNIGTATWRNILNTQIDERVPAVNRVNEKESLLAGIELFSTAALQPFNALEAMNATRPDSLYFQNLRAGAERDATQESFFLRMKGVSSSAAEADRFAASIRSNPLFSSVQLSDLRSQNNRTDFNLFVRLPANTEMPTEEAP